MAAIGKAHVEIVPDVSKFAGRLRAAADALEGVVSGDVVVVGREAFDKLREAVGIVGMTTLPSLPDMTPRDVDEHRLYKAAREVVDTSDPTGAAS